jgi:hypothetical protein
VQMGLPDCTMSVATFSGSRLPACTHHQKPCPPPQSPPLPVPAQRRRGHRTCPLRRRPRAWGSSSMCQQLNCHSHAGLTPRQQAGPQACQDARCRLQAPSVGSPYSSALAVGPWCTLLAWAWRVRCPPARVAGFARRRLRPTSAAALSNTAASSASDSSSASSVPSKRPGPSSSLPSSPSSSAQNARLLSHGMSFRH